MCLFSVLITNYITRFVDKSYPFGFLSTNHSCSKCQLLNSISYIYKIFFFNISNELNLHKMVQVHLHLRTWSICWPT